MTDEYDLTYISFGAGVQSTAMLALSCLEEQGVPRADVAIFADTGCEPTWTHEHIAKCRVWAGHRGMEIKVVSAGNMMEDAVSRCTAGGKSRMATIPMFTLGEDGRAAPLKRQCTADYKIKPIEKAVREMLGLKKGQRAKGKFKVRCMIGISTDEMQRMKDSRTAWVDNCWPLVDANINRDMCKRIAMEHGMPEPRKSSCTICPFHNNHYWQMMKHQHPEEFEKAVEFDLQIRNMSRAGVRRPVYLHRSLKPLGEIDFAEGGQMFMFEDMIDECDGMCGL